MSILIYGREPHRREQRLDVQPRRPVPPPRLRFRLGWEGRPLARREARRGGRRLRGRRLSARALEGHHGDDEVHLEALPEDRHLRSLTQP